MARELAPTASEAIAGMANRLVERFAPQMVILFGSYARGDADEDSDVDLLVVMPDVTERRPLAIEMRRALRTARLPKDILVLSCAEYERDRHIPGTIAYPAAREGVVLYARD